MMTTSANSQGIKILNYINIDHITNRPQTNLLTRQNNIKILNYDEYKEEEEGRE